MLKSSQTFPFFFDSRKKWEKAIPPPRTYERCIASYAFTVTQTIAARIAIKHSESFKLLSPQYLISCLSDDLGCFEQNTPEYLSPIQEKGLPLEECMPFISGSGKVPSCPKACINGSIPTLYKVARFEKLSPSVALKSLFKDGPLFMFMKIYSDFFLYSSGIYKFRSGTLEGWHCVMIVGWGVEDDTKYWILQNCWSDKWGEQGYFRMERGSNVCDCERNIYAPIIDE